MDSNPFFTGGVGLALLGAAAGVARRVGAAGTMMARRHLLMTLEVTNKDPSFPWVLHWLTTQGHRSQHLSVNTTAFKRSDGSTGLRFDMMPGPGRHLIPYKNRWFWVERERQVNSVTLETGTPWEKVVMTTIGRDPTVFDHLLQDARTAALAKADGTDTLTIYTCWGADWKPFGHPRRKRPLTSVVLDDGIGERIMGDLQEWRHSAKWYYERGVPYRRGYLLHGPPGSGKTSYIYAIAGHLDYDICMLSLSEEGMSDDRLAHALSQAPQRSIILLEDVDAAFLHRSASASSRGRVTFSGLLNTLDGVTSSEERLIFMTTNFVERLDPALMRPGRVDVVEYIGAASTNQMRRLFAQFYPALPASSDLPDNFASQVDTAARSGVSMAALQGYLLLHKLRPEEAVAMAHDHFAQKERETTAASLAELITPTSAELVPQAEVELIDGRPNRTKRRPISAFELDKMFYNPQQGSGFE
ncbi:BCS1 N terminal-domain-containing protein [Tribonema minus]|uniref:BCS1 N terminal-domain-containing protein n=1 Tax=Tribonema minus TaxID=303371 RepID=A0A835YK68_9STRA|nr:BCS1 N terminal-domain-containing protein [Tribonema minus]